MRRAGIAVGLAALLSLALAWGQRGALRPGISVPAMPSAAAGAAATEAPQRVLLRLFRGRREPAPQDVSVTTLLGPGMPTVVVDPDLAQATDDDLRAQLASVFSMSQVLALGSTVTDLAGGRALLDDDMGLPLEVSIEGHPAAARSARLVLSLRRAGRELIATSLVARSGRTVNVAGPQADPAPADYARGPCASLIFVAVTVIQDQPHS
jgi:hypothetical protein